MASGSDNTRPARGGSTKPLLSSCFPLGTALLFLGGVATEAATFNIADGNLAALSIAIQQANTNGEDDTINLAPEGLYIASGAFSGDDALPALGPDDTHALIDQRQRRHAAPQHRRREPPISGS